MNIKYVDTTAVGDEFTSRIVGSVESERAISIPVAFESSAALDECAALYERYSQIATAQPFDPDACHVAYLAWKAVFDQLFDSMTITEFREAQNKLYQRRFEGAHPQED